MSKKDHETRFHVFGGASSNLPSILSARQILGKFELSKVKPCEANQTRVTKIE